MSHLELITLAVRDYDAAIRFFVNVLQFHLVEDCSSFRHRAMNHMVEWRCFSISKENAGTSWAKSSGDNRADVNEWSDVRP